MVQLVLNHSNDSMEFYDCYIFVGELYESIKREYSRASGQMSSSSETEVGHPKQKRAKLHPTERQQEKQRLTALLENIKENIKIKEARVNKAKSVQDYKLCDKMQAEIRELLKDKADYKRQFSSIERKEQKSIWYHSMSKISKIKEKDGSKRKEPYVLSKMFKPVEKDALFRTTSTASSHGTGTTLSETSCTSDTPEVTKSYLGITIDETATSKSPAATCSLQRSASISSTDTLIINSSEEDF